jgi:hypothetical protein
MKIFFSFFLELSQIDWFDVANQLEAIDGRVSFLRVQFNEVENKFLGAIQKIHLKFRAILGPPPPPPPHESVSFCNTPVL